MAFVVPGMQKNLDVVHCFGRNFVITKKTENITYKEVFKLNDMLADKTNSSRIGRIECITQFFLWGIQFETIPLCLDLLHKQC